MGKKSGFVDSRFMKTRNELVIGQLFTPKLGTDLMTTGHMEMVSEFKTIFYLFQHVSKSRLFFPI
jgi:hypothetical protein